MLASTRLLVLLAALVLAGCGSTSAFTTTWKSPDATPLGFKSQKVAAAVLLKDESARRLAEDRLSYEISARGAEGRTLYSLFPGAAADNEKEARAALEAAGVKGVIVMRPVNVDKTVRVTPPYEGQGYASFWGGGGYYGSGFAVSYSSPREASVSETTVVYVETLVYSLDQNKLVWGGLSKSTNPDTLAELIGELSTAATAELEKAGLIRKQ